MTFWCLATSLAPSVSGIWRRKHWKGDGVLLQSNKTFIYILTGKRYTLNKWIDWIDKYIIDTKKRKKFVDDKVFYYFEINGMHVKLKYMIYSVPRSGDKPYTGLKTLLFHPESKDHRFAVLYDQGVDVWLFSQSQDQVQVTQSFNIPDTDLKMSPLEKFYSIYIPTSP